MLVALSSFCDRRIKDDMPTDFAPRKTASVNKRVKRQGMFSGRSFAVGAVCGAVATLALIYVPGLISRLFGDADPALVDPVPEEPALTYEFMRRLPNDEVVTNVTPYHPPQQQPASSMTEPSNQDAEATETGSSTVAVNDENLLQVADFPNRDDEVVTNVTPYQPLQQQPASSMPEPSNQDAKATEAGSSTVAVNDEYLFQVAAFRNREDADELRAELILDGLGKVAVNTVPRSGGETMYRVLVGPFPKQEMVRTRATLQARNIAPLLVSNAPG